MRKTGPFVALAIGLLLLGSCVLPGTGTIHVKNRLSDQKDIARLYIYPTGSPDTQIDHGTLSYNETHDEIGLEPGPWTVECVVEGYGSIVDDVLVEEGVFHILWVDYP
jgi:hypothetical protein